MTTERYQPWQELHPGSAPFAQSERARKSMLPPNYPNRAKRRENVPIHGPNWHQKTPGKADTRERLGHEHRCLCAAAASAGQRGRITGLNVGERIQG